MPDIVLATLNARYTHASFGLRCLRANLDELRERSVILEGITKERALDFVTRILEEKPRIVGLGVYIWNARPMFDVVTLLRQIAPDVTVVLGGPEVSYEIEDQPMCALAHHVVTQEGEIAFRDLCRALLSSKPSLGLAPGHVIEGGAPAIETLALAYDEYTDEDLHQRIVYVEASRGCPFRCAFCLSALDKKVRAIPAPKFFDALQRLYERGLRRFKFVDRTFNLDLNFAKEILAFFHAKLDPTAAETDLFLHFEMVPDRLPSELIDDLARFPEGCVQLEVGIQTFNPEVANVLERRTDFDRACDNIRALRDRTGVHIHADLIAGLPRENPASFARGFNRLVDAGPHEIQLGILKRLRGFPLANKREADALIFESTPPYEVLRSDAMTFEDMVRMRRIARTWDLSFNQGRFPRVGALLLDAWRDDDDNDGSVFAGLSILNDELHLRMKTTFGLSLLDLAHMLFDELCRIGVPRADVVIAMEADYCEGEKRRRPPFLDENAAAAKAEAKAPAIPARQRRHAAANGNR